MHVHTIYTPPTTTIDTIDYVNGIGNCSREQYIRARTPCYSLHPWLRKIWPQKWPKNRGSWQLSIKNSWTKVVSSLKITYPSQDVLALNVDSEDGVPKPLCEGLQSHKSMKLKRPIFRPYRSLLAHYGRLQCSQKIASSVFLPQHLGFVAFLTLQLQY